MRATSLLILTASLLLPLQLQAANCLRDPVKKLLERSSNYHSTIVDAARKHGVDANLIRSVIAVESCYNPKAVSAAGAEGLMQLMPDTAERFGVTDSFDIKQNISAGTRYLKFLQQRYPGDLKKALAAYNAGEGKVDQYKGVPPYAETQQYVQDVTRIFRSLAPHKFGPVIAKPGREGIEALRRKAPHLFKPQPPEAVAGDALLPLAGS